MIQKGKKKINLYIVFVTIFFGVIIGYLGLITSPVVDEPENKLPIHISSEDFKNGIVFTDLNAIEGVSQEEYIVLDGILEYDD